MGYPPVFGIKLMLTYKGYAIVKYPQGKAAGDYTGGLPRDAENEVLLNTPFICGADAGVHGGIGGPGSNCGLSS